MALQRTVKGTFDKGPDIQGRVSLVEVESERLAELADFITTKHENGRGYHIPVSELPEVIRALELIALECGLGSVLLGADRG